MAALDGEPFDERRLRPIVVEVLRSAGFEAPDAERGADIVRGLVLADPALRALDDAAVTRWFDDPPVGGAIQVHSAGGIRWFDREAFETLAATVSRLVGKPDPRRVAALAAGAEAAGYRVDGFRAASLVGTDPARETEPTSPCRHQAALERPGRPTRPRAPAGLGHLARTPATPHAP